jgi:hypothetical protein
MDTKALSPEGAEEESPGREPWVHAKGGAEPCKGETVNFALAGLELIRYVLSQGLRLVLSCRTLSGSLSTPYLSAIRDMNLI